MFSINHFYSVLLYCALFGYVLSIEFASNPEHLEDFEDSVNVTISCGGIINENRGRISYKVFEPLLPNERCVWMVRGPKSGEYDVYLDSLGLPSSLIINAFTYNDCRSLIPDAPGDYFVGNTSVLVITLHTGPENYTQDATGFSLLFFGQPSGFNISGHSEDTMIPANSGHQKFPKVREYYDRRELSTTLVTPLPESNGNFYETEVVFTLKGLTNKTCYDFVDCYLFDESFSSANKWTLHDQFCGDTESAIITHRDLILFVFQSDYSRREGNTGFHLYTHINQCSI